MRSTMYLSIIAIAALGSSGCTAQDAGTVQTTGNPIVQGVTDQAEAAEPVSMFASSFLQSHNKARAEVGADPLVWNEDLARDAEEYAQILAGMNRIEHASEEARNGAGENLWIGTTGYFSTTAMMDAFLMEKAKFKPGVFPDVSTTGNWADVGHYTQIIWKETREVGCAVVNNTQNDVLVCRYMPAGNWRGTQLP